MALELENWIRIGIGLVVLILYIITLFLFIEIKNRTKQRIRNTLIYLTIGIVILVIMGILNVLNKVDILVIPFLYEALVLAFSVFLLLATANYLKSLKKWTDKKIKKISYFSNR